MSCPVRVVVGALLMTAAAAVTIAFTARSGPGAAVDNPPPSPSPPPYSLKPAVVDLDGQRYRCLVTYNDHGVDCDWDHPITQIPTPAPSRTDR